MKSFTRSIPKFALLALALSLAACGTTPKAAQNSAALKLATIKIGSSVTEAALKATMPEGKVLFFDAEAGSAIVALPAQNAQGTELQAQALQNSSLSSLDASLIDLEPDEELAVLADPESLGSVTWAGGTTTWAGGNITWAGGQSFLDSSTLNAVATYWTKVGLPTAHQLVPEMGAGVKVAIVDTGIDVTHPLLASRIDTAAGWDYVDNDSDSKEEQSASASTNNKFGHGTAVAGIIAQYAPNARLISYRALKPNGSGKNSAVIQAIGAAVKAGAKVINLSLGSTTDTTALNTAIASAIAQGAVVVVASGNTGKEGMLYPARKAGSAQFPADGGLLAVGSVTSINNKSSFTSYGSNMSLTAPGEGIVTTFPNSRLVTASGTSFAAPAVSGAVALALSAAPNTPAVLAQGVRASTSANADQLYNSKLGKGTLNAGQFVRLFR